MKILRLSVALAAFGIALMIGFNNGSQINLLDQLIQISLNSTHPPKPPAKGQDQLNLIIIGVSDYHQGQLESIWLAAYSEITQNITFVPIFPSPNDPEQNQLLADAFNLDQGKPDRIFWNTLRNSQKIWWQGYILSDQLTTIDIVNAMGGIYVNNILLNGDQAVNHIVHWEENSQLAVRQQGMLLESICKRLVETKPLESKTSWELFIKQPIDTDLQTTLQVTNWISRIRKNGMVNCVFPAAVYPQARLDTP